MTILSWRDDYCVGIDQVDSEHKSLFDLVNALHDAHQSGGTRKDVLAALSRLIAYAEQHFAHEEALMAQHEYPKLDQHRQLHEALVTSVFDLNEKLQSGARHVDSDLLKFLKNWLVEHILHDDMEFAGFLEHQNAGKPAAAPLPPE